MLSSALTFDEILDDIDGYVQGPVGGVRQKYFPNLDAAQNVVCTNDGVARLGSQDTKPASLSPETFLDRFSDFSTHSSAAPQRKWHKHHSSTPGPASAFLSLTLLPQSQSGTLISWADVLVIGQFYRDSSIEYRDGFVTLCKHAREVFCSQPTRLFLHAFYIRSTMLELLIFDRSGVYSDDVIDLNTDSGQIFSILRTYQSMTTNALGVSDIIQSDGEGDHIALKGTASNPSSKLYLEANTIALSEELVNSGPTCYRARTPGSSRWDYVVKFKWQSASDRSEVKMLRLAKERCVWGVVSLENNHDLASTAQLRQGLSCGPYRKFRPKQNQDRMTLEGKSGDPSLPMVTSGLVDHTEKTGRSFEDLIFTCVVISPAGRPLRTFGGVLELSNALRDAVKGHRSLFQSAKILHQDVSPQNIIITDAPDGGKPKGILIDLDRALDLANTPSASNEVVGTRPFMAIGILKKRRHTYRHDLESFLYTFLWTAIANGAENPPRESRLRQWSQGTWDDSAATKMSDMDGNNFKRILAEFPDDLASMRPVAETIRQILFPMEDGALWIGTDGSAAVVNGLYEGIIGAFDQVVSSIPCKNE